MELSNSNVETFLMFSQKKAALISQETENPKILFILSQKKAFIIFRKTETPNSFFIFQEIEFSNILGTRNSKNFLYFRKENFRRSKNKKITLKRFLIFREMELLIKLFVLLIKRL